MTITFVTNAAAVPPSPQKFKTASSPARTGSRPMNNPAALEQCPEDGGDMRCLYQYSHRGRHYGCDGILGCGYWTAGPLLQRLFGATPRWYDNGKKVTHDE